MPVKAWACPQVQNMVELNSYRRLLKFKKRFQTTFPSSKNFNKVFWTSSCCNPVVTKELTSLKQFRSHEIEKKSAKTCWLKMNTALFSNFKLHLSGKILFGRLKKVLIKFLRGGIKNRFDRNVRS